MVNQRRLEIGLILEVPVEAPFRHVKLIDNIIQAQSRGSIPGKYLQTLGKPLIPRKSAWIHHHRTDRYCLSKSFILPSEILEIVIFAG
jgi:hypothetical protein